MINVIKKTKEVFFLLKYSSLKCYDVISSRRGGSRSFIKYSNKYSLNKKKLLIYVVHLHGLHIPDSLKINIQNFLALDYDIILTITHSGSRLRDLLNEFSDLSKSLKVIIRKNYGKDFGGLYDSLKIIDPKSFESIFIMNDSMIGPLYESNFIELIEGMDSDFCGVTESYGPVWHIQSSIMLFKSKKSILCLQKFFQEVYKLYNHRENIVKYGECGLSQYMIKNGVSTKSLFESMLLMGIQEGRFTGVALASINPQHEFGSYFLTDCNFPFIKRELLTRNPSGKDIDWVRIRKKIGVIGVSLINSAVKSRL